MSLMTLLVIMHASHACIVVINCTSLLCDSKWAEFLIPKVFSWYSGPPPPPQINSQLADLDLPPLHAIPFRLKTEFH